MVQRKGTEKQKPQTQASNWYEKKLLLLSCLVKKWTKLLTETFRPKARWHAEMKAKLESPIQIWPDNKSNTSMARIHEQINPRHCLWYINEDANLHCKPLTLNTHTHSQQKLQLNGVGSRQKNSKEKRQKKSTKNITPLTPTLQPHKIKRCI